MAGGVSQRPTRRETLALAATLAIPAGLTFIQLPPPARVAGLLLLPLLGAMVWGRRFEAGWLARIASRFLLLGLVVPAYLIVTYLTGRRPTFGLSTTLILLAFAAPAVWFTLSRRQLAVTLGLGLVALMGMARSASPLGFGGGVAAYLLGGLLAWMAADPTWALPRARLPAALGPLAAALGLAVFLMAALARLLLVSEPVVSEALLPYVLGEGGQAVAGFGVGPIRLGQQREILLSDEPVLRIWGGSPDHLRGMVYRRYLTGRWELERPGRTLAEAGADGRLEWNERRSFQPDEALRLEPRTLADQVLFAPLATELLFDVPGGTLLDDRGVIRLGSAGPGERRAYRLLLALAPARPLGARLPAPEAVDLEVPVASHDALLALAREWSAGATTDEERLDRIRQRFARDFRYSLSLPGVPVHQDPVLQFLQVFRAGHCEYFASSYVLLSRVLGVPARLVTGYRVFEYNPVGRYSVVRQRDAHAWAEVWLGGRWQTRDPTPPGVLAGEQAGQMGWLAGQWDQIERLVQQAWSWLADRTAGEILATLVGGAGVLLLWLVIRRRVQRRRDRGQAIAGFAPLERLERHLRTHQQVSRLPHQTLTEFALTLQRQGLDEAARLYEACARLRYGGLGDPDALAQEVDRYLAGVKRT